MNSMTIRLMEGRRKWNHQRELQFPLCMDGDLNLMDLAKALGVNTDLQRVRVRASFTVTLDKHHDLKNYDLQVLHPKNSNPCHEYKAGYVESADLEDLISDGYLRVVAEALKKSGKRGLSAAGPG